MKRVIDMVKAIWAVACLLLIVVFLPSCAPTVTRYVKVPLSHEQRPILPKISANDLECLSQATYQKLYDRQRLLTDYAVTLEALIDSAGD